MTHGCLLIIDGRRKLWLHTYHTGTDIPIVVRKAIQVLAEKWKFVAAIGMKGGETAEEAVEAFLSSGSCEESLTYGKSAAALIIAAEPCFLEPLTAGYRRDLPTWSGLGHPYVLRISEERWKLSDEEGKPLFDLDIAAELKSALIEAVKA